MPTATHNLRSHSHFLSSAYRDYSKTNILHPRSTSFSGLKSSKLPISNAFSHQSLPPITSTTPFSLKTHIQSISNSFSYIIRQCREPIGFYTAKKKKKNVRKLLLHIISVFMLWPLQNAHIHHNFHELITLCAVNTSLQSCICIEVKSTYI